MFLRLLPKPRLRASKWPSAWIFPAAANRVRLYAPVLAGVTYMKQHGEVKRAIGAGISQSGRFLRSFLADGFNADEQGKKVFEGVWAHSAASVSLRTFLLSHPTNRWPSRRKPALRPN